MTKDELNKLKEFAHEYSQRFKYCFTYSSGEKNYPEVFSKLHYGRFTDFFADKHNIEIKITDENAYRAYLSIMTEEINKFIDECKKIQSEKDKKAAKNKNVKRKKD